MPKIKPDPYQKNVAQKSAAGFAALCATLKEYHDQGRLVFSDPYEGKPDIPPDDPDIIAAAMD